METLPYAAYFERRLDVCHGELVIKGTRVMVKTLLGSLAEGGPFDEILRDFPSVSPDALRAVIAYAAHAAVEDIFWSVPMAVES